MAERPEREDGVEGCVGSEREIPGVYADHNGPIAADLTRLLGRLVELARTMIRSGEFDRLVGASMMEAAASLWNRIDERALAAERGG